MHATISTRFQPHSTIPHRGEIRSLWTYSTVRHFPNDANCFNPFQKVLAEPPSEDSAQGDSWKNTRAEKKIDTFRSLPVADQFFGMMNDVRISTFEGGRVLCLLKLPVWLNAEDITPFRVSSRVYLFPSTRLGRKERRTKRPGSYPAFFTWEAPVFVCNSGGRFPKWCC
jgi:hypothetical protein